MYFRRTHSARLQPMSLATANLLVRLLFHLRLAKAGVSLQNMLNSMLKSFVDAAKGAMKTIQTDLQDLDLPCPADYINQDVLNGVVTVITSLFKQIETMIDNTFAIAVGLMEQVKKLKKFANELNDCEWSNLYGLNIDIDLPFLGNIIKGHGIYITYEWKEKNERKGLDEICLYINASFFYGKKHVELY